LNLPVVDFSRRVARLEARKVTQLVDLAPADKNRRQAQDKSNLQRKAFCEKR
jgi:hypothetical protein